MKINIVCVGKLTPEWVTIFNLYAKRINIAHELSVMEVREVNHDNPEVQRQRETALLVEVASKMRNVYLCSLEGKTFDSVAFSALFNVPEITFVIGGSHGVIETFFKQKIAFSRLTFPHQMFRVILAEQIFRGLAIKGNNKYHK